MSRMNHHYGDLPDSYFFTQLGERTRAFMKAHPGESILRLGVGDVTQPLCPAVIEALHRAVEEQAHGETFHGYVAENGSRFYREAVRGYYLLRGIELDAGEIFASCGAGDELGDVLDLFGPENTALVPEPAYPAYVDTNLMAGHKVIRLPAGPEYGFAPWPDPSVQADILYLCSPNNPTGAVYTREKLQAWVDYANARQAVLIFDAAYEAFVGDPALPRSIYVRHRDQLPVQNRRVYRHPLRLHRGAQSAGTGGHVPPRHVGAQPGYQDQRRFLHSAKGSRRRLYARRHSPDPGGHCRIQAERQGTYGGAGSLRSVVLRRGKRPLHLPALPAGDGQLDFL